MPREMSSDAEMVAYVARTRGAIGYVSGGANTDSVKVLTVAPESFRRERILLKRVEPEYPKELQQRRIAGTVRLALTVSPRGSVEDVRVMGGNPILAEAAEKAAKEWVYSPSATRSTIEVSIAFAVRP
jgi:TonB family protein